MKFIVKKIENRRWGLTSDVYYIDTTYDVYLAVKDGHSLVCECPNRKLAEQIRNLLNKHIKNKKEWQ